MVTREESNLYSRIIIEQITLQELQAQASRLTDEDQAEGKRLAFARQIKTQQAVLLRLWDRARLLEGGTSTVAARVSKGGRLFRLPGSSTP